MQHALLLTVKKEHGSTVEKRGRRSHLPGLLKRIGNSHYSLHPTKKWLDDLANCILWWCWKTGYNTKRIKVKHHCCILIEWISHKHLKKFSSLRRRPTEHFIFELSHSSSAYDEPSSFMWAMWYNRHPVSSLGQAACMFWAESLSLATVYQ